MTAFFKFLIVRRAEMKDLNVPNINVAVGEEWRRMSFEEKKKWTYMTPPGQSQQPYDQLNNGTLFKENTNDTTATWASEQASLLSQKHNYETAYSPENE